MVVERKAYPSDLTDEQWSILEPLIPKEKHGGRHREVDMREVVNAILYITRTGCQWRMVIVHSAGIQDRDGAHLPLEKMACYFSRLQVIFADGVYAGKLIQWVTKTFESRVRLEIVPKLDGQHEFKVLRWRWIVERTFGWLGRSRRLSKDYERLPETSENWIRIAMTSLMLRRLTPL